MRITVLLFASYADAFGSDALEVSLAEGSTVRDLLARIRELAGSRALPPAPLVAVNQQYARVDEPIGAGDEVALIPPVAGG